MINKNVGNFTGILADDAKVISEGKALITVEAVDESKEGPNKNISITFSVGGHLYERVVKKGKKGRAVSVDYKLDCPDNGIPNDNSPFGCIITTNIDFLKASEGSGTSSQSMSGTSPSTIIHVGDIFVGDTHTTIGSTGTTTSTSTTVSGGPTSAGWSSGVSEAISDNKTETFGVTLEVSKSIPVLRTETEQGRKQIENPKPNYDKSKPVSNKNKYNKNNHKTKISKENEKSNKLPVVRVVEIDSDGEKINTAEIAAQAVFQRHEIVKAEKLASVAKEGDKLPGKSNVVTTGGNNQGLNQPVRKKKKRRKSKKNRGTDTNNVVNNNTGAVPGGSIKHVSAKINGGEAAAG